MHDKALAWLGVADLPAGAFQTRAGKLRQLHGGKNSAPKPDPEFTKWQTEAIKASIGLAERQEARNEARAPLEEEQLRRNLAANEQQQRWNEQDRERFTRLQDLYERELGSYINEANAFDKGRRESELTAQYLPRALADVEQSFGAERDADTRAALRMGKNPSDGALSAQFDGKKALARVLAYQNTRDSIRSQVEAESDKYRNNALNALAGNTGALRGTVSTGANVMGAGVNAFQNILNGQASRAANVGSMLNGAANAAGSAYSDQYNRYIQAQNANTRNWAAGIGAVASFGSLFSDRRLKTNIKRVGVDGRTGLNIYEYEFRNGNGQRWRGVMADEVREKYPDAVFRVGEFDAVDYAALGIKVEAVQ